MILRWGCLVVTLLYLPSIRPQESVSTESPKSSTCDPGLFSCIDGGSCIPMEWVGDNEIDCADGSDEHGSTGNLPNLPLSAKSAKIKQKVQKIKNFNNCIF